MTVSCPAGLLLIVIAVGASDAAEMPAELLVITKTLALPITITCGLQNADIIMMEIITLSPVMMRFAELAQGDF